MDTGVPRRQHGPGIDQEWRNWLPKPPTEAALLQSVSTVTFSVQLHKLHSKVRTSRPPGPNTIPVNVIGPWHFGHGGRSISLRPGSAKRDCGMFARLRSAGARNSQSPVAAKKETVMPDQCLKVHPVPRTKGQPRLKSGHEPLERLADHRIGPGSISPLNKLVGGCRQGVDCRSPPLERITGSSQTSR
jgi:hypothetical protein